jgi:hypothetical protein
MSIRQRNMIFRAKMDAWRPEQRVDDANLCVVCGERRYRTPDLAAAATRIGRYLPPLCHTCITARMSFAAPAKGDVKRNGGGPLTKRDLEAVVRSVLDWDKDPEGRSPLLRAVDFAALDDRRRGAP